MRSLRFLALIVAVACGVGLFLVSYAYFRAQELEKAEARLSLYQSTVRAELQRFSHLPFLLSLDPVVISTLAGGDPGQLDTRLARFAHSAGLDAIYVMDLEGKTISASNASLPISFVGQNYAFRPYFQAALDGELGEFYGIGATTGIPGYFFAMAVRPQQAQNQGVVAIKQDLSALQRIWQASGERIILSNADGVVLLASKPDWRYRTLAPLGAEQRAQILEARQFGEEPLEPLNWERDAHRQSAVIGGQRFLYLQTADLPNSWSLHFFAPDDQALTSAWLITGAAMLVGGLMFLTWQIRRNRQISVALALSEQEEVKLREANDRLAIEIQDRRAAEQNLQKTQAELERAGRLAALGQLASSVTHELGQPIAAMRNQLAVSEMASGATPLNEKMKGLVARMEDITRQLKFFSRKGRDKFETVDLGLVVLGAMELMKPNISEIDAKVPVDLPDTPIKTYGNKLRLEQVMVNLMRNALDAIEEADTREIRVSLGQDEASAWFEVADTGHGLEGKTMEDLREPFTTTRESGKGMGLGLTISAGIVSDHGGVMSAHEREGGGAVFRATLPRHSESKGS